MLLEQCLPFTVLKHIVNNFRPFTVLKVGTVLTVYGIETFRLWSTDWAIWKELEQCLPFTVLKRIDHCFS